MCAWLLVFLADNKLVNTSPWTSDLSGLPLSNRRAYGRIVSSPFQFRDATLKRLHSLQTKDSSGHIIGEKPLYALTLTSTNGSSATVYFTRETGLLMERFEVRHRPNEKSTKRSVPTGITSIQFIAPDPKTEEMTPHVYHERFSTRLNFGGFRDGRATGSIVMVFPDSKRSFVSGAFKARLVGFAQP